jgi:hypothetical protein
MPFFRVDYHAYLVDGRCFRPATWIVMNDAPNAQIAAQFVRGDTRAEAWLWHSIGCVVTVLAVSEVRAADYEAHKRDVRCVIALVETDPICIQREAARRGVLPTLIAEEYKHAAAWMRLAAKTQPSTW